MPFNGSGGFTRVRNWVADATAKIKIKADFHDAEDDNLASGLSNTICKDGQTAITADIPWNGKKITNLAVPTGPNDAATKGYTDGKLDFSTTGVLIPGSGAAASIRFADADIGFGTRRAGVPAGSLNRFVWNDKPDLSGGDIATMTDVGDFSLIGMFNCDRVMGNTFYDRVTPAWKAVAAGWSAQMDFDPATGNTIWYASTATAAAGATVTLNQNMTLTPAGNLSVRGTATATGRVKGGDVLSVGVVYANNGSTVLGTDGNITGTVWSNWGANDAYSAIGARIEARAAAFANDRVANLQYRKVSQGYSGAATSFTAPAGAVLNGYERDAGPQSGQLRGCYFVYLQVFDPVRGWVGFTG